MVKTRWRTTWSVFGLALALFAFIALFERGSRPGDPDARAPGGESRREVGRRVGRALHALVARHAGRRIAVVTHLGVILTLLPGARLANARHQRVSVAELDLPLLCRLGVRRPSD